MTELLKAVQDSELVYRLGWVLIHFLWQGAVIAGVLWLALRLLARRGPQVRYLVACAAMLLMVAAPVATLFWSHRPSPTDHAVSVPATASEKPIPATKPARPLPIAMLNLLDERRPAMTESFRDVVTQPKEMAEFHFLSPAEIERLHDYESAVEDELLKRLDEGDHNSAIMLGDLKCRRALPLLRKHLLASRYFYGWETSYDNSEAYLRDDQYFEQMSYILAIERITGKPVAQAVMLTNAERETLETEAANCRVATHPGGGDDMPDTSPWAAKWLLLKLTSNWEKHTAVVAAAPLMEPPSTMTSWGNVAAWFEPALPYAVSIWLAGVIVCSIWHLGGWLMVRRLRRTGALLAGGEQESAWLSALKSLAERFRLRRPVRLLKVAHLAGPVVVGILRPAVLIPAAVITGLTPPQIEAILAHELAHIRRHDYMVNLIQTLIETMLFYHPAVWWVSARIRTERENCCDDIAIAAGAEPFSYAESLLHVVRHTAAQPQGRSRALNTAGVRATGRASELRTRIDRLLGSQENTRHVRSWPIAVILLAAIAGSMLLVNCGRQARNTSPTTSPTSAAADSANRDPATTTQPNTEQLTVKFTTLKLEGKRPPDCPAWTLDGKPVDPEAWHEVSDNLNGWIGNDPRDGIEILAMVIHCPAGNPKDITDVRLEDATGKRVTSGFSTWSANGTEWLVVGMTIARKDLPASARVSLAYKSSPTARVYLDLMNLAPLVARASASQPATGPATKPATEPADEMPTAQEAVKIQALLQQLRSTDERTSRQAAISLGEFGARAKSAIPDLIASMSRVNWRENSAATLARIGPAAVPALLEAAHGDNVAIRNGAVRALGLVTPVSPGILNILFEAFKRLETQGEASSALSHVGPPAVPRLLSPEFASVSKGSAGLILSKMKPLPVPALLDAMRSDDSNVQEVAIDAFSYAGDKEIVRSKAVSEALGKFLDSKNPRTVNHVGQILLRAGANEDKAIAALGHILVEDKGIYPQGAAEILREAGVRAKPAIPQLVFALGNENHWIRRSAALALGAIGHDAASTSPDLAALLQDEVSDVRECAFAALMQVCIEGKAPKPRGLQLLPVPKTMRVVVREASYDLDGQAFDSVAQLITATKKTAGGWNVPVADVTIRVSAEPQAKWTRLTGVLNQLAQAGSNEIYYAALKGPTTAPAIGAPSTRAASGPASQPAVPIASMLGRQWKELQPELAARGIIARDATWEYILSLPEKGYGNIGIEVHGGVVDQLEVWVGNGMPGFTSKVAGAIEPGADVADVEKAQGKPIYEVRGREGQWCKAWKVGDYIVVAYRGISDGPQIERVMAYRMALLPPTKRLLPYGNYDEFAKLLISLGGRQAYADAATNPATQPATAPATQPAWSDEVEGLRVRVTALNGGQFRRATGLSIQIEIRNFGDKPVEYRRISFVPLIRALISGQEKDVSLVAADRPAINGGDYKDEGSIAPGQTVTWTAGSERMLASQPQVLSAKAGDTLQLKVRLGVQGKGYDASKGGPWVDLAAPPLTVKLVDDFPVVLKDSDIPKTWSPAMTLVYRERGMFLGDIWLRVDGRGQALLIRSRQGREDKEIPPGVYAAVLSKEQLDALAALMQKHEFKIWPETNPPTDQNQTELLLSVGGARAYSEFLQPAETREPQLAALRAEMHKLMVAVVKAPTPATRPASAPATMAATQPASQPAMTFSQEYAAALKTNPASVTLDISVPKTEYHIGETIPVTLTFRNASTQPYQVWAGTYDRSGRISDVWFAVDGPAGGWADPLAQYFMLQGGFMGGGLGNYAKLGEHIQAFDMNEWVRFDKPGVYRFYCQTVRVEAADGKNERLPVVSQIVDLKITPADDAFVQAAITQARRNLSDAKLRPQAVRTLRFLASPEAVEILIGLADDPKIGLEAMFGLLGARDRAAAIQAIRKKLDDPDVALDMPLETAFVELSLSPDDQPKFTIEPGERNTYVLQTEALKQKRSRLATELTEYVVKGLQAKRGRALASTCAHLLFDAKLDNKHLWLGLAATFPLLTPDERKRVLSDDLWALAKCPEFEAVLAKIVDQPLKKEEWTDAGEQSLAVLRYGDFQPKLAQAIILADISLANPCLSRKAAFSLPAERLPPDFDAVLLKNLTDPQGTDLGKLVPLIEHYGTKALLPDVMARYQKSEGRWACDIEESFLQFWIKHDRQAGLDALARVTRSRQTGCYKMVLVDTLGGNWQDDLQAFLMPFLEEPSADVAAQAAQLLGEHGDNGCAEPLISALASRPATGDHTDKDDRDQMGARYAIIYVLANGKHFQLTAEQRKRIAGLLKTDIEKSRFATMAPTSRPATGPATAPATRPASQPATRPSWLPAGPPVDRKRVAKLIDDLKLQDVKTVANAVAELGQMGEGAKDAVPALVVLLDRDDAGFRTIAAWALGRIGPPAKDAVPKIVKALRDKSLKGDGAYEAGVACARALGRIGVGDKDVVAALVEQLDSKGSVAEYALFALGALGNQAVGAVDDIRAKTGDGPLKAAGENAILRITSNGGSDPDLVNMIIGQKATFTCQYFAGERMKSGPYVTVYDPNGRLIVGAQPSGKELKGADKQWMAIDGTVSERYISWPGSRQQAEFQLVHDIEILQARSVTSPPWLAEIQPATRPSP